MSERMCAHCGKRQPGAGEADPIVYEIEVPAGVDPDEYAYGVIQRALELAGARVLWDE